MILMIDYQSGLMLMNINEYVSIVKMLVKYLEILCVVVVERKAYARLNLQIDIDYNKINIDYLTFSDNIEWLTMKFQLILKSDHWSSSLRLKIFF